MGLDEVGIRLDRAKAHRDALNAVIDGLAWGQHPPLHVITYDWDDNRIIDVEWTHGPEHHWGTIVGDCLHNLRCALDHIVWELSDGPNGNAPRASEFPIFDDRDKFLKRRPNGKPDTFSGLRKIEGVDDTNARTAIRGLQPFQRSDTARHPLWVLHELNNIDKHRALPIITSYAHIELWRRGIHDLPDLPPGWRQARATSSPEYVATMAARGHHKVKMRFDLAIYVTLEPKTVGSHEPLDVVLSEIIDFFDTEVVPAFSPYL